MSAAVIVRPTLPPRPVAFSRLNFVGATGVGENGLSLAAHGVTVSPMKNWRTARAAHCSSDRSLASVEWPVYGTESTCAAGISALTAFASSSGVRTSAAPSMTSVGTFGSGPAGVGAGAGVGPAEAQRDHLARQRRRAVERAERALAQRRARRR